MSLVSVIIPMFNAENTIERTLQSVCNQTHGHLEILVVNDGSTDGSAQIVDRLSFDDERIKLISKTNGGVASARNLGIAHATSEFIGVVDADDLWHPAFIKKTYRELLACGENTSFVYALNRRINADDEVIGNFPLYDCKGNVLNQHTYVNFVGNGSAMLMRKACILDVGGYDESLHARGGQGCEDWMIQMRLAENYQVGLVPEYLVGYRKMPGQMSENFDEMSLSLSLVMEKMKARCPSLPDWAIKWTRAQSKNWELLTCLKRRNLSGALKSSMAAFAYDPWATLVESAPNFAMVIARKAKVKILGPETEKLDAKEVPKNFYVLSPNENISLPKRGLRNRRLMKLRRLDQRLAQSAA